MKKIYYTILIFIFFQSCAPIKTAEGLSKTIMHLLKNALTNSGILAKIGAMLIMPALQGLKNKLDPAEYGGAPLLGVNGEFIICHGSSKAKAIKNAVRVSMEFNRSNAINIIKEKLPK